MATRYRALAAPVGVSTGDGRRFAPGAITMGDMPLPVRFVCSDVGGHSGAVTVGAVEDADMSDPANIYVTVRMFDDVDPTVVPELAQSVAHAMALIGEGVMGISVDLDEFEATPVEKGTDQPVDAGEPMAMPPDDAELLITKGRVRACTLVDIPAYAETSGNFELLQDPMEGIPEEEVEPVVEEDDGPIVASISGSTDLPVTDDREHPWDGPGAAGRVFDEYSDDAGNVDKSRAGRAFLWVDGDGTKRGDYKLGFADIVDGALKIVPRGVAATAGGRGVDSTDIPAADKDAVKSRICSLYATVRGKFDDWPDCPFDSAAPAAPPAPAQSAAAVAAYRSLVAQAGPTGYPVDVFTPPVPITGPTQITFDVERGMVYGHIFQHGVCHVGISDECRMPPTGEDFRYFHVHPVETVDGTVYAGRITAGGTHPSAALSLPDTQRAYDTKETVGWVRASVDEYGILVCGPLDRGIHPDTLSTVLSRRKVSGHWPEVGSQGDIYLAEVLALSPGRPQDSEPGFPVGMAFRAGRMVGLTASLGPSRSTAKATSVKVDVAALTRSVYRMIKDEEQAATEAAALRAQVDEEERAALEEMRGALMRAMGD